MRMTRRTSLKVDAFKSLERKYHVLDGSSDIVDDSTASQILGKVISFSCNLYIRDLSLIEIADLDNRSSSQNEKIKVVIHLAKFP